MAEQFGVDLNRVREFLAAMEGTGVPVDVVELEKVPPDVAERIRERGALVHERSDP